ncbi:MAG: peroxiredoxin family protein [Myxococcales bacterium]|nr:redoxin domain-containing protein [Myxococcales bacterium]
MFPKVGDRVPDLDLLDEAGKPAKLSSLAGRGPLLTLSFSGPDDRAGIKLLRDFRDMTLALRQMGVSICGIARADPMSLAYMRAERGLGFPLFADPDGWLDETGLLLIDRNLTVKQRAIGARADADRLLAFVRRGGTRKRGLRDRVGHVLLALSHAIAPRRLAR